MTRQDKTRLDKTKQDKTRQDKAEHDMPRQDKTRHDKTRQDKTRQDKTRQDKTRQDKTYILLCFRCLLLCNCDSIYIYIYSLDKNQKQLLHELERSGFRCNGSNGSDEFADNTAILKCMITAGM